MERMSSNEPPTSARYNAETGTQFRANAELSYATMWVKMPTCPKHIAVAALAVLWLKML